MTNIRALKKGLALLGGMGLLVLAVACGGGTAGRVGAPPTTSPPTSSETVGPTVLPSTSVPARPNGG
ncbi:hypothetical protein [Mycobacterium ahvazicum]|uniref:hypothetical protein n=1 Tax=Mycobacterium ahvazicum TaxID=1964395 RepID=UPI0013FE26F7|nr:hypothetical protein [Mycobacterium ahvazicum]